MIEAEGDIRSYFRLNDQQSHSDELAPELKPQEGERPHHVAIWREKRVAGSGNVWG